MSVAPEDVWDGGVVAGSDGQYSAEAELAGQRSRAVTVLGRAVGRLTALTSLSLQLKMGDTQPLDNLHDLGWQLRSLWSIDVFKFCLLCRAGQMTLHVMMRRLASCCVHMWQVLESMCMS